ncbi:hypothetical protein FSP39_018797 [Pinctada imbricata]|uniref:C2H2-type domain-containing protein n=1 Tax=Pinctada imbricata TaxID=66713 RepID=A0AA88YV27_PINIB|nr:hypothetical protein FSP39_018797 [Pinctada imbricata]
MLALITYFVNLSKVWNFHLHFLTSGESTMYQIMSECSAAVRKSVEGVDYYVAEASEAFHDLEDMVDKIQMSQDTRSKLLQSLVKAKHYLKTDYKMHVKPSSNVADHCFTFALSEQKSENFAEECPHDHNHKCQQCDELEETLSEIKRLTADMEWENPEANLFQVEKSIKAVEELKGHILRSKNQERGRADITGSLKVGEMFVVSDWAMKFLPRKYREGQTDWFGKRGINWHITVCATKPHDQYVLDTYVHILESQAPQDSQITSALIIDAIKDMVYSRNITDVHLWSDNAGCYKSTYTMYALHQELIELKTYYFCEAQDGKGPCDRKASHIKSAIKRFVNEGNNVLDASDMKKAIDTMQKGQYKVKVVTPIIDVEADKIKPIPSISLMHNFEFLPDGLKVWRAYKVGTDDHIDQDDFEEPTPKRKKTAPEEFHCSNDQCDRLFKSMSALENHLIIGDCMSRPEKLLVDKCKVLYQKRLDVNFTGSRTLNSETNVTDVDNLEDIGWALKTKKPKSHFTEEQRLFPTREIPTRKPNVSPYGEPSDVLKSITSEYSTPYDARSSTSAIVTVKAEPKPKRTKTRSFKDSFRNSLRKLTSKKVKKKEEKEDSGYSEIGDFSRTKTKVAFATNSKEKVLHKECTIEYSKADNLNPYAVIFLNKEEINEC